MLFSCSAGVSPLVAQASRLHSSLVEQTSSRHCSLVAQASRLHSFFFGPTRMQARRLRYKTPRICPSSLASWRLCVRQLSLSPYFTPAIRMQTLGCKIAAPGGRYASIAFSDPPSRSKSESESPSMISCDENMLKTTRGIGTWIALTGRNVFGHPIPGRRHASRCAGPRDLPRAILGRPYGAAKRRPRRSFERGHVVAPRTALGTCPRSPSSPPGLRSRGPSRLLGPTRMQARRLRYKTRRMWPSTLAGMP